MIALDEKRYSSGTPSSVPLLPAVKATFANSEFRKFVVSDFAYFTGLTIVQTGLLFYVTVLLEEEEELVAPHVHDQTREVALVEDTEAVIVAERHDHDFLARIRLRERLRNALGDGGEQLRRDHGLASVALAHLGAQVESGEDVGEADVRDRDRMRKRLFARAAEQIAVTSQKHAHATLGEDGVARLEREASGRERRDTEQQDEGGHASEHGRSVPLGRPPAHTGMRRETTCWVTNAPV